MTQTEFFISAATAAAVSPLGLFLVGVTAALLLQTRAPGARRAALCLTLLFAFACTDFCGKTMLSALEGLCADEKGPDAGPVVFVVLGGGAVAEGDTYQPSISSQRRLRHAQSLMASRGDAVLMLSGIESPVTARGVKGVPFLAETRSLNTRGNIRESAGLLRRLYPDESARPVVCFVTDRFHTFRAMRHARREMTDFSVCASPAPSLARRARWRPVHFIPTSGGLAVTTMAARELFALLRDSLTP